MAHPEYVTKYASHYLEALHTGSRAICPDAVTSESDDDYVLLVHPAVKNDLHGRLLNDGFTRGGSTRGGSFNSNQETPEFVSFKKTLDTGLVVNLILTDNEDFFAGWMKATSLSKALGLTKKADRVIVFEVFLYDNWPDNLGES